MTLSVTDPLSHPNDHIKSFAEALRKSKRLLKVFKALYSGGKSKTVSELRKTTNLSQIGVLQQTAKLRDRKVTNVVKAKGEETHFEKVGFWIQNRDRVLRLAANKERLDKVPTKYEPKVTMTTEKIVIRGGHQKAQFSAVTFEDFDQFERARKVKNAPAQRISEPDFKQGIKRLIGETGAFQDWGGEKNDLYTSKLRYKGKRRPLAFAFKGPGTKGILTPSG